MKKPKYHGMFYHGTLKTMRTNKTARLLNQRGRRIFGEKAEEYMKEYTQALMFKPRG
jgi:hypothetical protein